MKRQSGILSVLLALAAGATAWGQTTETHSFLNLNKAIPDGNASGLSDHQTVASSLAGISALRLKLRVEGEFNGDLYGYVRLVSDNNTNFCVLLNRVGRAASDPWGYADSGLNLTFDDAAPNGNIHGYQALTVPPAGTPLTGSWRPDGREVDPFTVVDSDPSSTSLSSFIGANPSGEWTLYLADVDSGATNLLVSWELEITGGTVPPVTWAAPADIVYGTPLGLTQQNASAGGIPGTFVYAPLPGSLLNAGAAQTLSVTFTPTDSTTYVPVSKTVSINVTSAPLTIAAKSHAKTYGQVVLLDPTVPSADFTVAGLVNGDTVTSVALNCPGSLASATVAGSPYAITPGAAVGTGLANYAINFLAGTLTVAPSSTTGLLNSSANPAAPGQSVAFTMQVTAVAPGSGTPTGTVQFRVDGVAAGAPVVMAGGTASVSLSTLTFGLHTVTAEYAGDGNVLGTTAAMAQQQLINTTPVAAADTIERPLSAETKVLIATLMSNDSDADGGTLQFLSFSATSAQGGSVVRDGDWLRYSPPIGHTNNDSFTYTIADAFSAQATATVLVRAHADVVPSPNLVLVNLGNGSFRLEFNGIPGLTYQIEVSEAVPSSSWQGLGTGTADEFGMFEYTDTPPPAAPQRFYRSIHP